LAQEMKVPGHVKVFELEWAQVNAVAWTVYRAVGFSRALLQLMTRDEVRAIAAHELAHITEPRQVRAVRVCQMFAYLPAVPLMKYGGAAAPCAISNCYPRASIVAPKGCYPMAFVFG